MTTPVVESVPLDLTEDRPSISKGRQTYDMRVSVEAGASVQTGVIARLPQTMLDHVLPYPATVRLMLEIEET